MSTEAQIAANQENAQLSTGPVTAEGKAAVAKNALKTGLTGQTVLLPSDDAERYAEHLEAYRARYSPSGPAELELVQRIADTTWRLNRIPNLESGLFIVGQDQFADLHPEVEGPARAILIQTETFRAFEKDFRNLMTQESRLRRSLEKDAAALKQMQQERLANEAHRLTEAAHALITAIKNGQARSFDPNAIGFEFSIARIEARAARIEPQLLAHYQANKPRHMRTAGE